MDAKKARAALLRERGDEDGYERLNSEILRSYLEESDEHSGHLSYLNHAGEYLLGRAEAVADSPERRSWAERIYRMGRSAEALGEGHYWFPYLFLIWASSALGREREAQVWAKKAFVLLNVLVEEQMADLEALARRSGYNGVAEAVRSLWSDWRASPETKPDYYHQPVPYGVLSEMTDEEVESLAVTFPARPLDRPRSRG